MSNETETTQGAKKRRGRPRGSVNRRSQIARDIVERLNVDPLEALLRIIKNRRLPIELRLDAAKAATPFVHARLSTTQVFADVRQNVEVDHKIQELAASDPAIARALEAVALKLAESSMPVIDVTPARLALGTPEDEDDL